MGRSWEDLLVWKKAHELVLSVYENISNFPKDEKYGLISQIKRCSISIPANIVEGHSKNSNKEFLRFLYISRGSLEELKYYFLLVKDLSFITENKYNFFYEKLTEIGFLLNQLIKSLTSNTSTTSITSNTSTTFTTSKKESYNGKCF